MSDLTHDLSIAGAPSLAAAPAPVLAAAPAPVLAAAPVPAAPPVRVLARASVRDDYALILALLLVEGFINVACINL